MKFIGLRIIGWIFLLSVGYSKANAQAIKNFVQNETKRIRSIEPADTNFSDLEVIGNAIGDARIVMMGEQDHGDAPTFLAKTRLIKYLHEQKGFNVLAFESDFFALTEGWDQLLKAKGDMRQFLKRNVFSIWTDCDACNDLFNNYIPASYASSQPLAVTGFDSQLILGYSNVMLSFYLDSIFRKFELPLVSQPYYRSEILPLIDTLISMYSAREKSVGVYTKIDSSLNLVLAQMQENKDVPSYCLLIMKSLISLNNEFSLHKDWIGMNEVRDIAMAENLKWLVNEKFADQKIIVWAANAHIMRNTDNVNDKNVFTGMGTFFTHDSSLSRQTYVLGFTSGKGKAGRVGMQRYKVVNPVANSFESWIDRSFDYSFTDFKEYNNRIRENNKWFSMKGYAHAYLYEVWNKSFDGIFFIRKMYPCNQMP